jgi:uncharacterized protein (UPF0548 family)
VKHKPESYLEKTKKTNKKIQWGPVIPLRRSTRHVDNGKDVLENAQDFKRKWNLEDNAGINKKSSKTLAISENLLLSVAKDIGIGIEDGNPILQKMVELDSNRVIYMEAKCSHQDCVGKNLEKGSCSHRFRS